MQPARLLTVLCPSRYAMKVAILLLLCLSCAVVSTHELRPFFHCANPLFGSFLRHSVSVALRQSSFTSTSAAASSLPPWWVSFPPGNRFSYSTKRCSLTLILQALAEEHDIVETEEVDVSRKLLGMFPTLMQCLCAVPSADPEIWAPDARQMFDGRRWSRVSVSHKLGTGHQMLLIC